MNHFHRFERTAWRPRQLLAFSGIDGPTDFDHAMVFRTGVADGKATLELKMPAPCTVQMHVAAEQPCVLAGDLFCIPAERPETPGIQVRGAFLDTHHLLIEGPCTILERDESIAVLRDGVRTLLAPASHMAPAGLHADLERAMTARADWVMTRPIPPGLSPLGTEAFGKALSQLKTQIYSPEGVLRHRWSTSNRWPHRCMFNWDNAFHAIGLRHFDLPLSRELVLALLETQREDGFISHAIGPDGGSMHTQPPLLAFTARLLDTASRDTAWLAAIYPGICAWIEWILSNRGGHDRLLQWRLDENPVCRCGESGMDNSPRFDGMTHLEAVDLNCYVASECEALAEIADILHKANEAARWRGLHRHRCELISERFWNAEAGFFLDYDLDHNRHSDVLACSGFLPLLCGAATRESAERLARHATDSSMFGTPFPMPTVAASDSLHYDKDMWKGPAWINMSWLIAHGFRRYGLNAAADFITEGTLHGVDKYFETYGTHFEFYDDRMQADPPRLKRKGECNPTDPYRWCFADYGWTAACYLDMVVSNHATVRHEPVHRFMPDSRANGDARDTPSALDPHLPRAL